MHTHSHTYTHTHVHKHVHPFYPAANERTEDLDGTVGNHLIAVHVGLGARPCLPNAQRELAVVIAIHHLRRQTEATAKEQSGQVRRQEGKLMLSQVTRTHAHM